MGSDGRGTRFRKGTLGYTTGGLILLFFYLLWGDFCMQIMEVVVQSVLPLQLKSLGASNTVMALLVTTLPSIMNLSVNPMISFRSDSFRSSMGRRLPFLIFATPFVTLFLILVAFAPEIGGYLSRASSLRGLGLSPASVIIGTMAVLLVLFQFFNFCLMPVYCYLFVDVVPDAVIGRFVALFRVVATLSSYVFNTFLLGHALTHTREIYIGAALLYLIGFGIVCWRVREGKYPPPVHVNRLGLHRTIGIYMRECYSHPHYLLFNVRNALYYLSTVVGMYAVFVFRDEVGLPLEFIGKINGWNCLIIAVLLFPMAILADRFKPVRIILLGSLPMVVLPPIAFFFLHDKTSYVILALLGLPFVALMAAAEMPFHISILPRERFGQFGSANQIVTALTVIVGSFLAGRFIDWTTLGGTRLSGYRYLYWWQFVCQSLSLVAMVFMYRSWRRHGGPSNYIPPTVASASGDDHPGECG